MKSGQSGEWSCCLCHEVMFVVTPIQSEYLLVTADELRDEHSGESAQVTELCD